MTLSDGFAPFYSDRPSSAMVELNQLYLGYAAVAILIGLLLVLPGVRGKSRIFFLFRWTTSLIIGASIIACVQGVSWHVAKVDAVMPYCVHTNKMERFEIGLKIGLVTFNVTLKGNLSRPSSHNPLLLSEEFHFLESDAALARGLKFGLPYPILNVLEHFSVDRVSSMWLWGRRYWLAGHYASYLLWSAFATWVFTNLLLHAVLRYGGLMLSFTGFLLVGANLSFYSVGHVGSHLEIRLGYYNSAVLRPVYGWCFWLCLLIGAMSIVFGFAICMADQFCYKALARFFNKKKKNEDVALYVTDIDDCSLASRRSSSVQLNKGCVNYSFESNNNDEEESASKNRLRFSEQLPRKYGKTAQTQQPSKENAAETMDRQTFGVSNQSSFKDKDGRGVSFLPKCFSSNQSVTLSGLSTVEDVQM